MNFPGIPNMPDLIFFEDICEKFHMILMGMAQNDMVYRL